jgi:hypothetical protein
MKNLLSVVVAKFLSSPKRLMLIGRHFINDERDDESTDIDTAVVSISLLRDSLERQINNSRIRLN